MTKKEKKIAMSLFAALGLSPAIVQAEPVLPQIGSEAAIVRAGDIEIGYGKSELAAALEIARGNGSQLPDGLYSNGARLLDEVEMLRHGDTPVEFKANSSDAEALIKGLVDTKEDAFRVDTSISAVIFVI